MNRTTVLAACILAIAVALPSSAQDMAATAGDQAKVVLENEKVRVIQLEIAPGAKTGMHSHGDNVVVFLTGGDAVQALPDGTTSERHSEAGEVFWSGPVTHDTTNRGQAATKVLVIELKDPAE
jgi:quercetin dioxygenase-like cupin family protein